MGKKKSKSLTEKLAESKEKGMTAMQETFGKIQAKLEGDLEAVKKDLKIEQAKVADLGKKVKAANEALANAELEIVQLKKKTAAIESQTFVRPDPVIPLENSSIRIAKQGDNEQYPDSFFPVGVLEADQIEKGTTLEDIKEFIKKEFGKGSYKIFAMTKDKNLGYERPSGNLIFSC